MGKFKTVALHLYSGKSLWYEYQYLNDSLFSPQSNYKQIVSVLAGHGKESTLGLNTLDNLKWNFLTNSSEVFLK